MKSLGYVPLDMKGNVVGGLLPTKAEADEEAKRLAERKKMQEIADSLNQKYNHSR